MRTVSIDLVKPAPVEHSTTRGECFADTLRAARADCRRPDTAPASTAPPSPADGASNADEPSTTDATTPDTTAKAGAAPKSETTSKTDGTSSDGGDFEAAIAMLGSLTTPMCAIAAPIDVSGTAPKAPTTDEPAVNPTCAQPGATVDDQHIMPIVVAPGPTITAPGDVIDDAALPSAPAVAPALTPPAPPTTVVPTPGSEAAGQAAGAPAAPPIIATTAAEAAAAPTGVNANADPANTERLATTDDTSLAAPPITDAQRDVVVTPLVDAGRASTGDAPSPDGAVADPQARTDRARGFKPPVDAVPAPSSPASTVEALPIGHVAVADGITRVAVAKSPQPLTQMSTIVGDLAQQARTDSSPRRVVIPLDPPALGRVTVEIIVRADSVKVSLQHADESTFNALNAQRPAIEAALESNGMHLSDFDVSSHQQQQASQRRSSNRRFETFAEQVEPDGALRL